jgi:threonine dehydrogenase-like Zn-dependent dehydrogenase
MRATVMFGAGDVRIENVPDARLIEPTDAVVTVTRACICGSDLWPYKTMEHTDSGRVMGHEAIGIVEAVGADVRTIKAGDLVVMPFAYSDGNCMQLSSREHRPKQYVSRGRTEHSSSCRSARTTR